MMLKTVNCNYVSSALAENYFKALINRFFKILPMRENGEGTLNVYMKGLQDELLGCKSFVPELCENARFLSLLSILQYLIDNECPVADVKRHVFEAISTCNKLHEMYKNMEV